MSRIGNARVMRSDNDPPFKAMDEHVRDVSRHPMAAASIGNPIAFPGLNHSHLAEEADCCLIYYVLETVGSAGDRGHGRRLVVGMIVEPALPIIGHKASNEGAVSAHVRLSPSPIECEKGITEIGLRSWPRRWL